MNIACIASLSSALVLAISVAACSSDGGTTSGGTTSGGTSGGKTSGGTSGGTSGSTSGSSSTSCSSASLNGRCLEGPSKGKSCCMPDDSTTCASGTDCNTVCEYCH